VTGRLNASQIPTPNLAALLGPPDTYLLPTLAAQDGQGFNIGYANRVRHCGGNNGRAIIPVMLVSESQFLL